MHKRLLDFFGSNATIESTILSRVADQSPDSIVITNQQGSILYVNLTFEAMTGYSYDEVLGKNPRILQSGKTSPSTHLDMWRVLMSGKQWKGEFCNKKKSGELFWEKAIIFGLRDQDGQISHFAAIKNDITTLKKIEQERQELFSVLNATGRLAKVGGWKLDLKSEPQTQTWTYEVYRIVEIEIADINKKLPKSFNFYSETSKSTIKKALQRAITFGTPYDLEVEIITKNGNRRWVHTTGEANREGGSPDSEIISISGAIQDITERKMLEDELKRISNTDGLTGLLNRRHFDEQLKIETERVIRYKHSLVLLFIDVDNFKSYNDLYGHSDGDQVLIRLAQVFKRSLRTTDLAYRFGGEEFTIMLPGMKLEEGVIVAEKIREVFSHEIFETTSNTNVQATLSIGVANYFGAETIEEFVRRTDKRMYEAKMSGKNKVCF